MFHFVRAIFNVTIIASCLTLSSVIFATDFFRPEQQFLREFQLFMPGHLASQLQEHGIKCEYTYPLGGRAFFHSSFTDDQLRHIAIGGSNNTIIWTNFSCQQGCSTLGEFIGEFGRPNITLVNRWIYYYWPTSGTMARAARNGKNRISAMSPFTQLVSATFQQYIHPDHAVASSR